MNIKEKKQAILNAIYKRAYELEQAAIEVLEMTTSKENIDYESLSGVALKKALSEWKENKQVFDVPEFLK